MIAQHASSPATVSVTANATTTLLTASFTPPSGSLLVAMAGMVYAGSGVAAATFTMSDSASGTWSNNAVIRSSNATAAGVFSRFVTTSSAMTCTLTTDATSKGKQLTVVVLTGVNTTTWAGATKTFQSSTVIGLAQSITTTVPGSWVLVGTAYDTTGTITANASTSQYTQLVDASDGARIQSGKSLNPTGNPGAITLGWTGDSAAVQKTYGALEVVPSAPDPIVITRQAVGRSNNW